MGRSTYGYRPRPDDNAELHCYLVQKRGVRLIHIQPGRLMQDGHVKEAKGVEMGSVVATTQVFLLRIIIG